MFSFCVDWFFFGVKCFLVFFSLGFCCFRVLVFLVGYSVLWVLVIVTVAVDKLGD